MKEHRHPHPHIDPRQPRNETQPSVNPPVFAWKPIDGTDGFDLVVARDAAFGDVAFEKSGLTEPVFLPEKALDAGTYWWKWAAAGRESEVFRFDIAEDASTLEVPSVEEWFAAMPKEHPRFWVRPEEVEALRGSRHGERAELWKTIEAEANALLEQPHEIEEPEYLPDRQLHYEKRAKMFFEIMWTSREFVRAAEKMALAYLASGDEKYGRAACEHMVSISKWDPEGSSYLASNDEAHMSSIWWGPSAVDWVWHLFTDDERAQVVEHLRKRGEITFDHMHNRGAYGVTRFDSHAGREIVFLAQIAFLIADEHPEEAKRWLTWLRPVLCGIWPVWAGDDGGWAEGISYSLAYVRIMTRFVFLLKKATGIDLFQKPFWRNYPAWRAWCFPAYAEWIGFGDHSERWAETWAGNADLVEIIDRGTGMHAYEQYVADFRREAKTAIVRFPTVGITSDPMIYLMPRTGEGTEGDGLTQKGSLQVFPDIGWAAVREDLKSMTENVALLFRSSPYGAVSHSHAANNDFIIHVAGKAMATPSGYYASYASAHHASWNWHTKSHNCATLSGGSQLLRNHESTGEVIHPFENEDLLYFAGVADPSYAQLADRYRRHVVYLKAHRAFFMVDEFAAKPKLCASYEWNIHSWAHFAVDDDQKRFRLAREGSVLEGAFMYHPATYMYLSEGWEAPFMEWKRNEQWRDQYHLRFATAIPMERVNMGAVLATGHEGAPPAKVDLDIQNNTEIARLGADTLLMRLGDKIDTEGIQTNALAALRVNGKTYEIDDAGLRAV